MKVVAIKKILVSNLLIYVYLHCVRSLLWCATTLATLAVVLGGSFVFASRAVTRSRNSLMLLVTSFIGVGIGFMAFSDSAVLQVMAIWVVKFPWRDTKSNIFLGNIITASWGPWKHPDPAPGGRPIFFKPEWPKESKNGFKTISCCPYRKVIFSNYFFRYQKSSKKSDGFTSN